MIYTNRTILESYHNPSAVRSLKEKHILALGKRPQNKTHINKHHRELRTPTGSLTLKPVGFVFPDGVCKIESHPGKRIHLRTVHSKVDIKDGQ